MTIAMNPRLQEVATGLTPMTYEEARTTFIANGGRPFSFVSASTLVMKTVVRTRYGIEAMPPTSWTR